MELDWRNRCVGGERLEDLCAVVHELNAADDEELFDQLWDDPHTALPFHRALLRIGRVVVAAGGDAGAVAPRPRGRLRVAHERRLRRTAAARRAGVRACRH